MHVGVIGPGAIGRLVGGRLIGTGHRVTFVGRTASVDRLGQEGFHIFEAAAESHVPAGAVQTATNVAAVAECDVMVISVKSGATASVAQDLAALGVPLPVVVSLQNGLVNVDVLRKICPPATIVVPGVVSFNVITEAETDVRRTMDGPILLGQSGNDIVKKLAAELGAAGIQTLTYADLVPHQWTKLLINLNNAMSALSGESTVRLLASRRYRRILASVMDEGLAVLRAAKIRPAALRGVPLPVMSTVLKMPTWVVRLFIGAQMRIDPEARSSMWEDLENRKATEVDVLNGAIVTLANQVGADAPINAHICRLIHDAVAAGEGSPQLSADALEAALHR